MNQGKKDVIGRRTGRNVTAGKKIRLLEDGFENFSDYWTDSGNEESSSIQIRGGNSTNQKTAVAQKKNEKLLKSVSPFSPSDHELSKSLLKNLNKNMAANHRRVSPSQNMPNTIVTEASNLSECEAGAEISDINVSNKAAASADSPTPEDAVSSKAEQGIVKSQLLIEGNAVGSFSKDNSGKLNLLPTVPNSALLTFKAKKRLTYSGGRNSEEHLLVSESKSPSKCKDLADDIHQDADLDFSTKLPKNKAGKSSSFKNTVTQEERNWGTAPTVEKMPSPKLLTTDKQDVQQNNDPVVNSDNESDSFMVLQKSCLTMRNEQEQEQEDIKLVPTPAKTKKLLERSKRKKRRYQSEDQLDEVDHGDETNVLPAKTTRRRNRIQDEYQKGTVETELKKMQSPKLLTRNKQDVQQNNDPVVNSDNESDSFMVLQKSCLKMRNKQEQEQEDVKLDPTPAKTKKLLERSKRKKRRYQSEDQLDEVDHGDETNVLPAKTTRRRNRIQDEYQKGTVETELTKSRNVVRHRSNHNLRLVQPEANLKKNTRRHSVKSKERQDVKFQLSFDFSDSDEDIVLPTVEKQLPNNIQQKAGATKMKGLRSRDHVGSTSSSMKTSKQTKQDQRISHSNIGINIDQLYTAHENDEFACLATRKPQRKGKHKSKALANSSEKAQSHDLSGGTTAELVKQRSSQKCHSKPYDLKTPALPMNKQGRKVRKNSKHIKLDNQNEIIPESTKESSGGGVSNLSVNKNHRVNQGHDGASSPVIADNKKEIEYGISPQQFLHKDHQAADVYTFDLEDEPTANKSDSKVNHRTQKKKLRKQKVGVPDGRLLTPDVSPIAPIRNSFINTSVLIDQSINLNGSSENGHLGYHQVASLKQQCSKRCMVPVVSKAAMTSRRSSHIHSGVLKSILKPCHSTTATPASLVHYCEVTNSQTPALIEPQQNNKENNRVKIILPEPCPEGLRRSQRTRVQPLDWFRNERIKYARRKSGLVVAGIESPKYEDYLKQKTRKQKLEHLVRRRRQRMKLKIPKTPKNLSVHEPISDDWQSTETTEIPVIDPTTQEEVLIDCVVTKKQYDFRNVFSEPASPYDPLILCKAMVQPAFSLGQLILRPLEEKCTQYLRNDSMIFVIKKGKVAVTIHKTTTVLETDDSFFIPRGNTYSIKNLRKDEAKFWFFQQKG